MGIYTSSKVLPYVYKLVHKKTGHFYIGYRCANTVPSSEDLGKKYFTSSKIVKPKFKEFDYFIIAEFFDSKSAKGFEYKTIFETQNDPLSLNGKIIEKFDFTGRQHTEEWIKMIRDLNTGKVNVFDLISRTWLKVSKEEYQNNDSFVTVGDKRNPKYKCHKISENFTKSQLGTCLTTAYDIITSQFVKITKDEYNQNNHRYLNANDKRVPGHKGKKTLCVFDTVTKSFVTISIADYNSNKERYLGIRSKKIASYI